MYLHGLVSSRRGLSVCSISGPEIMPFLPWRLVDFPRWYPLLYITVFSMVHGDPLISMLFVRCSVRVKKIKPRVSTNQPVAVGCVIVDTLCKRPSRGRRKLSAANVNTSRHIHFYSFPLIPILTIFTSLVWSLQRSQCNCYGLIIANVSRRMVTKVVRTKTFPEKIPVARISPDYSTLPVSLHCIPCRPFCIKNCVLLCPSKERLFEVKIAVCWKLYLECW